MNEKWWESVFSVIMMLKYLVVTLLLQHPGDRRGWLPHAGPVWLGECFLCVWSAVSPVGLLHVEIPTQRRRQVELSS